MIRTLALASAIAAASLSAHTLAAQSTSTSPTKPAAAPAMNHAPAVHVQSDTTRKATTKAAATTKTKSTAGARHATWTSAQVKEAQEGLTKAGLYKGKATGVLNKETRQALRAYQKQNKLPVTGRLSDSVLVKLKTS